MLHYKQDVKISDPIANARYLEMHLARAKVQIESNRFWGNVVGAIFTLG